MIFPISWAHELRVGLQEAHSRLADFDDIPGLLTSFEEFMTEKEVLRIISRELLHAADGPLGRQIFQSIAI